MYVWEPHIHKRFMGRKNVRPLGALSEGRVGAGAFRGKRAICPMVRAGVQ